MMHIKVTYCSNYNGASVEVDGEYVDDYKDPKAKAITEAVIDFGADTCTERGFYGDIDEVEEVAMKAVTEAYGLDVEFSFEEDDISS